MSEDTPQFVVAGHVAKDVTGDGFTIGGTATYSALTACNLGASVGVVTSASPDIPLKQYFGCAAVLNEPSPTATTFENRYLDGRRRQRLLARGAPLSAADFPAPWRMAPVVHLGPIAQELDDSLIDLFPQSLLVVTPQGWMRAWDADGTVRYRRWKPSKSRLARVDVLVFSEEDLAEDSEAREDLVAGARVAVITRGARGATVCWGASREDLPAFAAHEVDPTGAGDVFAAAFAVEYARTHDPLAAATFANCTASFSVERLGVAGVPTIAQVRERLAHGPLGTAAG